MLRPGADVLILHDKGDIDVQWFPCMQFLMYQSCSQFSPPELLVSSINSQIVVDCHFIPRNEETTKAAVEDWGQVGFLFTHLK